jgi:hypothetical protein
MAKSYEQRMAEIWRQREKRRIEKYRQMAMAKAWRRRNGVSASGVAKSNRKKNQTKKEKKISGSGGNSKA